MSKILRFLRYLDNITNPRCDNCCIRVNERSCIEEFTESGFYVCEKCKDKILSNGE